MTECIVVTKLQITDYDDLKAKIAALKTALTTVDSNAEIDVRFRDFTPKPPPPAE